MFKELAPLLRQRSVLLSLTRLEDDNIRVNVFPKKLVDGENEALTTPLTVTGTADELDVHLPSALTDYVGSNLGLSSSLETAKEQMAAAAKAAKEEAKSKSAKPASGRPEVAKTGAAAPSTPKPKPVPGDDKKAPVSPVKPAEPKKPAPPQTASLSISPHPRLQPSRFRRLPRMRATTKPRSWKRSRRREGTTKTPSPLRACALRYRARFGSGEGRAGVQGERTSGRELPRRSLGAFGRVLQSMPSAPAKAEDAQLPKLQYCSYSNIIKVRDK